MKRKSPNNAGFSLIEVLISIVLLGALVVPICTGLVLSFRLNAKTDDLMQAQLAVSSAVETLMAEGITEANGEDYGKTENNDRFPDVIIKTSKENDSDPYYVVVVSDNEGMVTVTTHIRAAGGGNP